MNRRVSWILPAALVVTLGLTGVACSSQGEGERCDQNNDNEDCASGLTCQTIEGQDSPICCPPAPQPASVSACIPGQPLQPDSGISSDTGSRDATNDVVQDTAEDVVSDVQQDAGEDAMADAPDDAVSDADAQPDAQPDAPADAPDDVADDAPADVEGDVSDAAG